MKSILNKCPICNSELEITRLYCSNCDTTIKGHFSPPTAPFAQLTQEQMQFMLNFVRCEGRFNRLEEELNISYPTLRNRLNELILALGYEPGREEPAPVSPPKVTPEERLSILEDLNQGKITFEEAQIRLKGKK
jgi:hypothetical protein